MARPRSRGRSRSMPSSGAEASSALRPVRAPGRCCGRVRRPPYGPALRHGRCHGASGGCGTYRAVFCVHWAWFRLPRSFPEIYRKSPPWATFANRLISRVLPGRYLMLAGLARDFSSGSPKIEVTSYHPLDLPPFVPGPAFAGLSATRGLCCGLVTQPGNRGSVTTARLIGL